MPIEEKELDGVAESIWKRTLDSMERGKYYSKNEISEKLVGKRLYESTSLRKYLPQEKRDEKKDPYVDWMVAYAFYTVDISNVESFLNYHMVMGKLKVGLKDGIPYYSKSKLKSED